MLHNAVVLYRRTITLSYIVSTNHKSPRLRIIPSERGVSPGDWSAGGGGQSLPPGQDPGAPQYGRRGVPGHWHRQDPEVMAVTDDESEQCVYTHL